jgi:2-haloacid dehalogenase
MTKHTPASVLVFDVNETLIDIECLSTIFKQLFGDEHVFREWFGQLITYSMAVTLSGIYADFFALGAGVLKMIGDIRGIAVTPGDVEALRQGMQSMPAHADVPQGLRILKDAGFRLVTLTNSPVQPHAPSPLTNAGLGDFFERQFSVAQWRVFKPAQVLYREVARELGVAPAVCCMIAAHAWDTIGAQSAGFSAALLRRPGNAPLPVPAVPQPQFIAPNLPALAHSMIERWQPKP